MVAQPPKKCSKLDLCAFSHVFFFYNLEVLVVTTWKEFNAPATTGGSRAHLSRHRCTSKSRPVTDLLKPKSEFKKKIQPKNACLSSFFAESYICATHVVGKCPKNVERVLLGCVPESTCPCRTNFGVEEMKCLKSKW